MATNEPTAKNVPLHESFDNFLTGLPDADNLLKQLAINTGYVAAGGAALAATPEIARMTGITNLLQLGMFNAPQQSTKIPTFYNTGSDKMLLQLDHFGMRQHTPEFIDKTLGRIHPVFQKGPTSDANRQTVQFLKNVNADVELGQLNPNVQRSSSKTLPHKYGNAVMKLKELEEVNNVPMNKRLIITDVDEYGVPYERMRRPLDPNDANEVRRVQNLISSNKTKDALNIHTPAQLNTKITENIAKQSDYSATSAGRWHRHEVVAEELIGHVNNKPNVDYKRMEQAGISKPKMTQAGKVFKNNPHALSLWNYSPDRNVTHSTVGKVIKDKKGRVIKVADIGSDKRSLLMSSTRDMQFVMGENVAKYADINNPKSVKKYAELAAHDFALKNKDVLVPKRKMHPQVVSHNAEIRRFMDNYKVVDGKLHINFSPKYKPHYLLGGVNADAHFWKGPKGGLKHSLLVSDVYDLGSFEKVAASKNTHITTAFRSNDTKSMQDYYDSLRTSKSNTQRVQQAIRDRDFKKIGKYTGASIKKGAKKIGRTIGTKNPAIKALTKGGKAGKILALALLAASAYGAKD